MKMNRRDFLKSSAITLGAAAVVEGVSSIVQKGPVAHAARPAPQYEIYALKYAGPFTSSVAMVFWNQEWDKTIDRNYYLWAIKGKDGFIIVDTGTSLSDNAKRKLKGYVNPVDALARIGANGSNVKHVVITHIHFDHVGGMEMFPQAFPRRNSTSRKRNSIFGSRTPSRKGSLSGALRTRWQMALSKIWREPTAFN